MTVNRLPFALEDLLREIQTVSGNEHPDVTITLDAGSFGPVTRELDNYRGCSVVGMHPGCPPEYRYKDVSIVKRGDE